MTKFNSTRYNLSLSYKNSYPLVGLVSLNLEYSYARAQAMSLQNSVRIYFLKSKTWKNSGNIYSHTRVFWFANTWLVQSFYLPKGFQNRRRSSFQPFSRKVKRFLKSIASSRKSLIRSTRKKRRPEIMKISGRRTSKKRPRPSLTTSQYCLTYYRASPLMKLRLTPPKRANSPLPASSFLLWFDFFSRAIHLETSIVSSLSQLWSVLWSEQLKLQVRWVWLSMSKLDLGNVETWIAYLKYRIKGKFERQSKSIVMPLLSHLKRSRSRISGCIIKCNGRFTRKQRASHTAYSYGRVRKSDLSQSVEQGLFSFPLKFGSVGITITISYHNGLQKIL